LIDAIISNRKSEYCCNVVCASGQFCAYPMN
jgi:hypothetical protein